MFTPFPSPIGQYCRDQRRLVDYTDRIFERYYPELRRDRDEAALRLAENLRKPRLRDAHADHRLGELFRAPYAGPGVTR